MYPSLMGSENLELGKDRRGLLDLSTSGEILMTSGGLCIWLWMEIGGGSSLRAFAVYAK